MQKHLRILYGCDDRYEIASATATVCVPFFDSIKIVNAGPHEFYDRLRKGVPDSVKVQQLTWFLEIESARRALIDDVPQNDWVMWLDADERPSKELLHDLDNVINMAENGGFDIIRFIWAEHTEGVPVPIAEPVPKSHEEFLNSGANYFMPNRCTKLKPNVKIMSHFGAHEEYANVDSKRMYSPHIVHHMKSFIQYYQSVVFSGFLNPGVHYNFSEIDKFREFLNLECYKNLKDFQRRTGVCTSNDLVRKLKIERDENFKKELKELFLSFPSDEKAAKMNHTDMLVTFRFMRIFADKYDLDVNSPHYPCGRECCNYNGIQL